MDCSADTKPLWERQQMKHTRNVRRQMKGNAVEQVIACVIWADKADNFSDRSFMTVKTIVRTNGLK
jgi:hypothetical protein